MATKIMAENINSYVHVRIVDDEDDMIISLLINGKQRNMKRSKQEPLKKVLKRIAISQAEQKKEGKKKRARVVSENITDVKLTCGGDIVSEETLNCFAWLEKNKLNIGDLQYDIVLNPPSVVSVTISPCCMIDYPIVPDCKLEFANRCNWEWHSDNKKLCSERVFTPVEDHIGQSLTVVCIPVGINEVCGATIEKTTPAITSGPTVCLSDCRYQYTPVIQDKNKFRLLSYNILADYYASQQYSREVLYPYCKPEALEIPYRQCLLGKELPNYHADILCLQEVGNQCYANYLAPLMETRGYFGCFHRKFGQIPEGEALFYRASSFMLLKEYGISLAEFLQQDGDNIRLLQQLKCSQNLIQSLTTKHSICQVVFLQCRARDKVVLAVTNTHLISHPLADHLRLLQTELCLRYLSKSVNEFRKLQDHIVEILPVFCGDFNSCPEFAVYEYLLKGHISSDHSDWSTHQHYEKYVFEKKRLKEAGKLSDGETCLEDSDELMGCTNQQTASEQRKVCVLSTADEFDDFPGIELHHTFNFINATGLPEYTNYTSGFSGTLDYIFVDGNKMKVERVVPLPTHQEVTKYLALPSVEHPSDHLAIVCDVVIPYI